ncbi:hypothetical protein H4R27_002959 [Coemansia aciculifera]|nr:hypothetical protein H4R27_002959 [Coemansia aciculifera]
MNTSASNSVVPSSAMDASASTQPQTLGIFKRPEFIAGIEDFRKHFGQEVRCKTTEGYTFLGLDKPVFGYTPLSQQQQQNHQDKPKSAPAKAPATDKSMAVGETLLVPNGISQASQPLPQAAGPALHARAVRAPAKTVATGSRGAQRESESTLDHLMSFIKPSPPPSANTTQHAVTLRSTAAQRPVFVKTVVVSQVQTRTNTMAPSLPAHIVPQSPSVKRLVALQHKVDALQHKVNALQGQEKLSKQQYSCERSSSTDVQKRNANTEAMERIKRESRGSDARDERLSAGSRSPAELDNGQHRRGDPPHSNTRKRPRPGFEFQIRVPKKARRQVLDAIAATTSNKRPANSYPAPGGGEELPIEPKRVRKADTSLANTPTVPLRQRTRSPPAPKSSRKSHTNHLSPTRSGSATRLASERRPRIAEKNRGGETEKEGSAYTAPTTTGHSRTVPGAPPVDIEQLKRQSARLEGFMRSFKHSGDAENSPKGRKELEIGYYLESLACCLEDFWCRSAFSAPSEMKKRWSTMLELCGHIRRTCNTRELSPIRGCAALITASVYYQLSSTTLEIVQGSRESSEPNNLASNVAKLLADMGKYEQSSRQLLSAYEVSRQFPQTWKRCVAVHSAHSTYEPRSYPMASKWPSVAYPVGATSNPMDVANFARQLGSEWLERSGLALKAPKGQTSA